MTEALPAVVAFGECMIELRTRTTGAVEVGYGGDTLNTAQHLAEMGVATAYLTAIGDDPLSARMRAGWAAAGIDTGLVATIAGAAAGLYAIEVDARGERSFTYWRSQSAARRLFEASDIDALLTRAAAVPWLVLSGITLSLFDAAGQARIAALAVQVAAAGGRVAFDPNYRPAGWPGPEAAIAAYRSIAPHAAIVLPSLDDERRLFGGDAAECFERWRGWGAAECVVKDGGTGAYVWADGAALLVPPPDVLDPIDTTGAGDAFNAGYLAARMRGEAAEDAARAGHACAGAAVMLRGALGAVL